jgi:protocatechuate 3,4-dioxygenase beta subunit
LLAQERPQAPNTCIVEGTVSNRNTGQPLPKARVNLRSVENGGRAYSATTGADGRFQLKDVEAGRYRLSATRAGYVVQEYGQHGVGQAGGLLVLDPGQRSNQLVFQMIPTSAIEGRILDSGGEPLANAQVRVMLREFRPGQSRLIPVGSASTDDRGEYRVWGLAPGRYFLAASHVAAADPSAIAVPVPELSGEADQSRESYAPTYYPGTVDFSRADAIELGPGEERSCTPLTMTTTRLVRLRGRLINTVNPLAARGISVQLEARAQGTGMAVFNGATTNDNQGSFEMQGVAPGSYYLTALWSDGGKQYVARQAIDVGASNAEGASLVLAPGVSLTGSIHSDAGAPIDMSSLRVHLSSRDNLPLTGSLAELKPDGAFSFANIPEGTFDVYVMGLPEGIFLKSARLDGLDTLDSGLTVKRGSPLSLEIELSRSTSEIEGVVLEGGKSAAAGAQVVLVPDGDRRARVDFYQLATTDPAGRFHLTGVAPGAYKLFSWASINPGAYQDPEFLRPFEKNAKPLTVPDSGHQAAELTLLSQ